MNPYSMDINKSIRKQEGHIFIGIKDKDEYLQVDLWAQVLRYYNTHPILTSHIYIIVIKMLLK